MTYCFRRLSVIVEKRKICSWSEIRMSRVLRTESFTSLYKSNKNYWRRVTNCNDLCGSWFQPKRFQNQSWSFDLKRESKNQWSFRSLTSQPFWVLNIPNKTEITPLQRTRAGKLKRHQISIFPLELSSSPHINHRTPHLQKRGSNW